MANDSESVASTILDPVSTPTQLVAEDTWQEVSDEYGPGSIVYVDPFPKGGELVDRLRDMPGYSELMTLMFVQGSICRYSSTAYVFVPFTMTWVPLRSPPACKFLAILLKYESVTVNYRTAVEPWFSFIETSCIERKPLPVSVNIGKIRFAVELIGASVSYTIAENIVPEAAFTGNTESRRISSSFCVSPIITPHAPSVISTTDQSRLERVLSRTMDDVSMTTLMWRLGNDLVDPHDRSYATFLYGSGGQGKTYAIEAIAATLQGAVHVLHKDHIGKANSHVSDDELLEMSMHRITVYGDCVITDGEINQSFIKTVYGGDSVNTVYGPLNIRVGGLFGVNSLWYPKREYLKAWFVRRVLCIEMTVSALAFNDSKYEPTDRDKIDFMSRCVMIRLSRPHPPITVRMALQTIFGAISHIATRGIRFYDRSEFMDCWAGTWAICIATNVAYDTLISLVETISDQCLITATRCVSKTVVKAIRGIQPIELVFEGSKRLYWPLIEP